MSKRKLTNKEILQLTIDEELLKFGNWLLKNTNRLYESGTRLPMKDILEMFKKENL